MKQFTLIAKYPHLPTKSKRLRQYRGQCSPSDAPTEPPHESHNQHYVTSYGEQRCIHGMARFSRCTQHGIHTKIHVGHHISQEDGLHELTGIRQSNIRRTEETKNRIKKYQADCHEQEAHNGIQRYRITKQMLSSSIITLP